MNASDGTNPNENNPNPFRSNDQRKGKGRQKMKMEKIEKESNLQVTFSKRRFGLFKKASELSTLCGAESALVVFTPSGKAHSYGNPNFEIVENRFLNTNIGPASQINPLLVAHPEASNNKLIQELNHKQGLLENEIRRKRELDRMFHLHINELDYNELKKLEKSLLGFRFVFQCQLKNSINLGGSTNIQGPNPEQLGGPSVGFNMTGYPNAGGSTQWAGSSTFSYPTPFDPNMGFQYPYGEGGSTHGAEGPGGAVGSNIFIPYNSRNPGGEDLSRDAMVATSENETEDETKTNVSNKSQGRGS
ncbi:hypothetical protein ACS0TY_031015 [Phlomoides rotata]